MNKTLLLTLVAFFMAFTAGCSSATPEESEAAKYPQTPPLSAAEQAKANELAGIPADKKSSH